MTITPTRVYRIIVKRFDDESVSVDVTKKYMSDFMQEREEHLV